MKTKFLRRFLWALPLLLFFCVPGAFAQCPSQTPNVGFQIPNVGNTTTWGLCLNTDLATLDNLLGGSSTFPVGTATAAIGQEVNWVTANTGSQTVTNITGGFQGQTINIFCGVSDTYTTITSSATIVLSAPWSCSSQKSITLTYIGTTWIEAGRHASTSVSWSSLTAPTGNLSLSMGSNTTTFTSTTSAPSWTWINTSAATSMVNQNSPKFTWTGQVWGTNPMPASYTNSYSLQMINGTMAFTSTLTESPVYPYTFDSNVEIAGNLNTNGIFSVFSTGSAGTVYVVTSAANAVGNVTTYQATISSGGQPYVGQNITIAGFVTHTANNGTFVVQGSTLTSLTLYNSAGTAETHAATATVDNVYVGNNGVSGYSLSNANINLLEFPILGTSYGIANQFSSTPSTPGFVSIVKGDVMDAGYWRTVNSGSTGNHFLEIGSIYDGTGAAPVLFRMGVYNGVIGPNVDVLGFNTNASTTVQHKISVIVLSSADLLALPGTTKTILSAPASGYFYRITSTDLSYTYGTTAYTIANSDNAFNFEYNGGTSLGISTNATGLVDQTVNTLASNGNGSKFLTATSNAITKSLILTLTGTTPALILGDGTLKATVTYDIVPQ